MDESSVLRELGQVSPGEAARVFHGYLRGCVLEMICEVMAAEVTQLCGTKHSPAGEAYFRSGSSPGRVIFEGKREEVVRPRVRQHQANGKTTEVPLASYESASNPEELQASIVKALMAGVSTREIKQVQPQAPGTSKSNVSRYWQQAGHQFVEELRGRDLSESDWAVLMLDGLRLSKDELIEIVLRLQRPSKTSRTSSKPPSLDKKARRENARPGGAKPGHKGHFRDLHDDPDETVDHRPGTCPCCQAKLDRRQLVHPTWHPTIALPGRCQGSIGANCHRSSKPRSRARPPDRELRQMRTRWFVAELENDLQPNQKPTAVGRLVRKCRRWFF